jgi:phage shock protein PspC (stress-responsive transcriptional regulator)
LDVLAFPAPLRGACRGFCTALGLALGFGAGFALGLLRGLGAGLARFFGLERAMVRYYAIAEK